MPSVPHMANVSKQIVTQSLMPNKHPLTFIQLQTSEGMLPNANKGICHRSFAFVVPSTYTHFRQTNAFVCRLFGICVCGFIRAQIFQLSWFLLNFPFSSNFSLIFSFFPKFLLNFPLNFPSGTHKSTAESYVVTRLLESFAVPIRQVVEILHTCSCATLWDLIEIFRTSLSVHSCDSYSSTKYRSFLKIINANQIKI